MMLFIYLTIGFIIIYLGICHLLDKLGYKSIADWLLSGFLVWYFIFAFAVFIYCYPLLFK